MCLVRSKVSRSIFAVVCTALFALTTAAQSTDQNFPSSVTTNEITGTIKARDIGDSRLTSYFYAFDGGQGDIFINVVTKNFSGDLDVFTADTLQPLTKMVIYADSGASETGRLIYMRRGERLILRVQGRSPNDDPATFQVKFGGSFIALAAEKAVEAPKVASSSETNESGVRVNSVGTIVAVIPKPVPVKPVKKSVVEIPVAKKEKPKNETAKPKAESEIPKEIPKKEAETKDGTVFENETAKVTVVPTEKPAAKRPPKTKAAPKVAKSSTKPPKPPATVEEPKPDPLASINLVIQLKDGNVIQRPMSEVVKFSVDKGVLVVVAKNGKIVRYSILDVAKVTIE